MNERDLETRLRDAYRAEAGNADPGALSERVHSIPATVEPQRRRWWHRFRSDATRHVGIRGAQVRGAGNMLTATRIAAVVAALALGTTFLAVQVDRSPGAAPAPAAPMGESWITVTGQQDIACNGSTQQCAGTNFDMSDPRLDGDVSITFSYEDGVAGDRGNYTLWGEVDVVNDDGTWEGNWIGFTDEVGRHHITSWFDGTGAYEGLKYVVQAYEPEGGINLIQTGLLYEGGFADTVVPPTIPAADSE